MKRGVIMYKKRMRIGAERGIEFSDEQLVNNVSNKIENDCILLLSYTKTKFLNIL